MVRQVIRIVEEGVKPRYSALACTILGMTPTGPDLRLLATNLGDVVNSVVRHAGLVTVDKDSEWKEGKSRNTGCTH